MKTKMNISVQLPVETVDAIDRLRKHCVSRSDVIRKMIFEALANEAAK